MRSLGKVLPPNAAVSIETSVIPVCMALALRVLEIITSGDEILFHIQVFRVLQFFPFK
jgi:hypothetical protein